MNKYREVKFNSSEEELDKFIKEIGNYAKDGWTFLGEAKHIDGCVGFSYRSKESGKVIVSVDKKRVCLTPQDKNSLSIDEYNAILCEFYNAIIYQYKINNLNFDSLLI